MVCHNESFQRQPLGFESHAVISGTSPWHTPTMSRPKNLYLQKGGKEGSDELGDWNWHIYTTDTVYKIDNEWESTVLHRDPYSVLCGDIDGKEIQNRGNICIQSWITAACQELTQHCKATILQYIFLKASISADRMNHRPMFYNFYCI